MITALFLKGAFENKAVEFFSHSTIHNHAFVTFSCLKNYLVSKLHLSSTY